ncbi:hypothetical protein Veis_0308 [Verminephrobacter eiseniae EF01-2]|uniref:Uncharacterized protein n=1 Tax=Verminephrobacter eiseniae (strain EF01-2) TaxID=391735 RepID=A1WEP2_VEREI|nr:hypothetical protein Veis_0308 [Verminephrobacter eiseniae EF01-2]
MTPMAGGRRGCHVLQAPASTRRRERSGRCWRMGVGAATGAWVGPRRAGARDNERSTNAYGKDGFAAQGCAGPIDCVMANRCQTIQTMPGPT